jgi:flagellar hook-length control protein FliK
MLTSVSSSQDPLSNSAGLLSFEGQSTLAEEEVEQAFRRHLHALMAQEDSPLHASLSQTDLAQLRQASPLFERYIRDFELDLEKASQQDVFQQLSDWLIAQGVVFDGGASLRQDSFSAGLQNKALNSSAVGQGEGLPSSADAGAVLGFFAGGEPSGAGLAAWSTEGQGQLASLTPAQSVVDIQAGGVQAGGVQAGGVQAGGVQAGGVQAGGVQAGGVQAGGVQAGGVQAGGVQAGGVQAGGVQAGGVQAGGVQAGGVQAGGVQAGGVQAGGVQAGELDDETANNALGGLSQSASPTAASPSLSGAPAEQATALEQSAAQAVALAQPVSHSPQGVTASKSVEAGGLLSGFSRPAHSAAFVSPNAKLGTQVASELVASAMGEAGQALSAGESAAKNMLTIMAQTNGAPLSALQQRMLLAEQQQAALNNSEQTENNETGSELMEGELPLSAALGERKASPMLASIAYPLRHPQWSTAVAKRVVFMANQQMQQAQITLNPEKLGPIQIRLHVERDQSIAVSMSAQHGATREALEQAIPRLKEMLEEAGITFSSLDVGEGDGFEEQGFSQQSGARGDGSTAQEPVAEQDTVITQSNNMIDFYA